MLEFWGEMGVGGWEGDGRWKKVARYLIAAGTIPRLGHVCWQRKSELLTELLRTRCV